METMTVFRDASGRLMMTKDADADPVPVRPVQFFPLTHPGEHWAVFLLAPDGALGQEAASIALPQDLEPASRDLLEQELMACFQKIRISRVCSLKKHDEGAFHWTVETDQGRLSFEVENQQGVNKIDDNFVLINDSEDRRFLIRLDEMDPRSRAFLDLVV